MQKRNGDLIASALAICLSAMAATASGQTQNGWVSAWSTAVHAPLAIPGLPPPATVDDQTVRMIIRPTIGGNAIRIRLSNECGTSAVEIGDAHVAVAGEGASTLPATDHRLTFGGAESVSIPPGAPTLSDPINLPIKPFTEIAVSLYLPHRSTAMTAHLLGQRPTYVSGTGDFSASPQIQAVSTASSWYWLSAVEVSSTRPSAAVVAFGDSITDGFGAKSGDYGDWPDLLAKRLASAPDNQEIAVLNEGIGGNRILHDGAGVSALARFDRDVLSQPGVTSLIVLEGINDIGWPKIKPSAGKDGAAPEANQFAHQVITAQEIILGLKQLIGRAHEHGITVFGGTLTPYEGAGYFSADGEATREEVNTWIRTGGAFDGVFDFDKAVHDPTHPTRFREDLQSGDHLHPNAAGYMAMAASINLAELRLAASRACSGHSSATK